MTARVGLALFIGLPIIVLVAVIVLAPRGGGDETAVSGERVVARVLSPDGRRTATVTAIAEIDGYLVRVDAQDAFLASGTKRLSVRWLHRSVLEIDFTRARATQTGKIDGLRLVVKGGSGVVVKSSGASPP